MIKTGQLELCLSGEQWRAALIISRRNCSVCSIPNRVNDSLWQDLARFQYNYSATAHGVSMLANNGVPRFFGSAHPAILELLKESYHLKIWPSSEN